ncbi:MAG: hypothetical protein AAF194_09560 [Pseudomonadota bacterium]
MTDMGGMFQEARALPSQHKSNLMIT